MKCLVSCSALVAQPAAGQLLTPLIRESSGATFENCPKSDTEQRRIRDPRRRQKRTLLRQKSSVLWKKGRRHSCPAVSYVYTERPCRVREPEVLADREGAARPDAGSDERGQNPSLHTLVFRRSDAT